MNKRLLLVQTLTSVASKQPSFTASLTRRQTIAAITTYTTSAITYKRSFGTFMTAKQQTEYFAKHVPIAEKACDFLTASPDPYHAVANSIKRLREAGFQPLQSHESFNKRTIQPGGKYYYHVHHSAIVAFVVGGQVKADSDAPIGFHVIGGHTDSPNLKVKPHSKKSGSGCKLLGVQCYGGGLWHTWLDRDLSICGKVLVRSGGENGNTGKIEPRLVKLDDPIARVSSLCIHLQSADERKALTVNKETHTVPIIATEQASVKEMLEQGAEDQINNKTTRDGWLEGQEPYLLQMIAEQLNVSVGQIADWDLNLYDTQPASLGGICKEFLYSARLDNLATVFCALESLIEYSTLTENVSTSSDIAIIVGFDHEEVGSESAEGAASPIMGQAVQRIASAIKNSYNTNGGCDVVINPDWYATCLEKSFILSIDMAHAIHPNFAGKHEPQHAPKLNHGIVIKTNANQRYTTNGTGTGFILRELGRQHPTTPIPMQEFVVKNDCPCGSTIGPTLSALTGIRTVDAGMPQLSMHSCREVMGISDLTHCMNLFQAFFKSFRSLDDSLSKNLS